MKFSNKVLLALFVALFPLLLAGQVIAYEQAREDSFLHQAHYHKNWFRYEEALVCAQKAIGFYQPQSSPKLAEAYFFAGAFSAYLDKGKESEAYYQKAFALYNPKDVSQKWRNFYALRAQHELQRKYQQKDSLAVSTQQFVELLKQNAGVAYEMELNAAICTHLYIYYFNTEQYDLANTFISEGYQYSQKGANKQSPLFWEVQLRYFQWQFLYGQNLLDSKKKAKVLLKEILTAKPLLPTAVLQGYKTEFLANMYVKDSMGLFTCFAQQKEFVLKHLGEQHPQMGYYYIDYAVMLKDGYMRRKEALVEIEKGMALLEKSPDFRDRQNYILACYNAGSMLTEISQTPEDYERGQMFFYKGLQMAIGTDGKKITVDDLPDFSDSKTRCDETVMAYRLLQALYYNRFYLYENSWTKPQQTTLLILLDKIAQLHERKMSILQNGANFEVVAQEYKEVQSNYLRFYWHSYTKDKLKAALEGILLHAENGKGIATRRYLNQDKAFALAGVPDKMVADYKREKANLQKLELQAATLLKDGRKNEAAPIQQAIVDKKLYIQKQETDLQKNYPQYGQLMYNPPVKTLTDIQKNLDKHSAFLYNFDFYETEKQLIISKDSVWVVDSTINKLFHLKALKNMLNFTQVVQSATLSEAELLDSLANFYRFWAKKAFSVDAALSERGINKLIISPAQFSNLIPFELLLLSDKKDGDGYSDLDYLLKKYAVQYVNSATLWLENKQQAAKNTHNGKVLAYAPTYQQGLRNEFRTGNLKSLRANLSELTGTLKEIENLKSFYYGDYRAGVEANEALFRKDIKQPYAILHLATHGLWDEDNPDLSALALSESADTLEDNFLSAYELAQLQTSSQLVVLSACETAKGEQKSTDGVMSIARYLMYGGAPAVIATRWQVNDQATAFIMQNFYKYLYEGKTVKEAIRTAQLDYLSQAKGIAAHPFYWAAFTNIGNTDASVYLASKDWAMKYYLIGILALLVIVGLGWWKYRKREK